MSENNTIYKEAENTDYTIIDMAMQYAINNTEFTLRYWIPYFNNFEANEIIKNIYLGSIKSVYDDVELKKNGITHVVSVISGFIPPFPNDFNYLVINAYDSENTNLFNIFDETNEFISNALDNGKILIHCKAGKSRSAAIVCAYIISTFGMRVNEALDSIKSKRDIIKPNDGFIKQLEKYYNHKYE